VIDDAESIQERLTPAAGVATDLIVSSDGTTVTATWTIDAERGWSEYVAWAANQLTPQYRALSVRGALATFRAEMGGDVHVVDITNERPPGGRIAVRFTARPF
jgi:hypothetical protein